MFERKPLWNHELHRNGAFFRYSGMDRWIIVLALLLAAGQQGRAQLVLDPVGWIDRPAGSWADSVLIAYDQDRPVGTILNPVTGRAVHAVFRDPAEQVLKRLLGPGLVPFAQGDVLLLKVNLLRVDERGTVSACFLHAEVLERRAGSYSRLFESSEVVHGKNATAKNARHELNIRAALDQFMRHYQKRAEVGTLSAIPVPSSEVTMPMRFAEHEMPILYTDTPRGGVYRSYMDLRMNTPDTTVDLELRTAWKALDTSQMVLVRKTPDHIVRTYWGLCDGDHSYVRYGDSFVRLDRTADGFEGYLPRPDSLDAGWVAFGAVFFGAVGAGVAAVATTRPVAPERHVLELYTGELLPDANTDLKRTYAAHVFQVSRYSKSEDAVRIICSGKDTVTIQKGEWTVIQCTPQVAAVPITILGPFGYRTVEVNTNSDDINVFLINIQKDGEIRVSELGEQMRNKVLDDLETVDRQPR
jgi:hypothetical protein